MILVGLLCVSLLALQILPWYLPGDIVPKGHDRPAANATQVLTSHLHDRDAHRSASWVWSPADRG